MPDVNVLVSAYRTEVDHHDRALEWLNAFVGANHGQVGLTTAVLTGYVRVVTHPRVFREPTPLATALRHVEQLQAAETTVPVTPGTRFWEIFAALCTTARARGNLTADAAHAATAIESGATWVTFDRDFSRFAGLRCELL